MTDLQSSCYDRKFNIITCIQARLAKNIEEYQNVKYFINLRHEQGRDIIILHRPFGTTNVYEYITIQYSISRRKLIEWPNISGGLFLKPGLCCYDDV